MLDILVNNAGRGMKYVRETFMTEPTRFWEVEVLMGIAIRLFLVIDAFSQFSGTPLACSADLSLCLVKQLLDSIATASG
jgi:hypothetical protein